jgi:predicted ATPase
VRLVERDAQLRRLEAALEEARRGRGTTVLVSGEAGIGKTSLLQEFADGAWATARVLVGACEDLLTPRPLGPFRDMARDAGGLAGPSVLRIELEGLSDEAVARPAPG